MSKVIDLIPHLKTINFREKPENAEVLNLADEKQKMLFHERRLVKRTILTELMSSYVVLPEKGLMKVDIHDISEEGISFEVEKANGSFKVGEEVTLRIYLNQKSYFPIQISIKHVTPDAETETIRHGTAYLKNDDNNVALQHFVKFVESASIGLKNDSGDLIFNRIS